MNIPNHFRLTFSTGSPWITSYLLKHSAKLPFSEAFVVSLKLYKDIEKVNKAVEQTGLPSYLQLAYVHPNVKTGVFLKPDSPAIPMGSFIGIYTGLYELVESDITTGTSYAYDVAQGLTLNKNQLEHVSGPRNPLKKKKSHSIQTNAITMGNFTRYINHTSLAPNIEAVLSKLPGGKLEVLLFALHTINPGQQLLSSYGGLYWKALGIIPDDMTPDTYLLTPALKVKLSNPIKKTSAQHKKELMTLRNIRVHLPLALENHSLIKALKKQIPKMSKQQKKNIDTFEDFVLELGLPRKWQLSLKKGVFNVSLKENEKTIRKNTFIGFIPGSFSLKPSSQSLLVASQKNINLFLDYSTENNFLSKLPTDTLKENINLLLVFDEDENTPVFLAFASKAIRANEDLILKKQIPILIKS